MKHTKTVFTGVLHEMPSRSERYRFLHLKFDTTDYLLTPFLDLRGQRVRVTVEVVGAEERVYEGKPQDNWPAPE